MSYAYGYVWRHDGRVISDEREHLSHSTQFAVISSEIMRGRWLLQLPSTVQVTILWRESREIRFESEIET